MSEHRVSWGQRKLIGTALAASVGVMGLAGCSSGPEFDSKHPSFNWGDDMPTFMHNMYNAQKVQKCTGQAALLLEGHVRLGPDPIDGGDDITYYSNNNRADVTIHNPEKMTVYQDNSVASTTWYLVAMPNGEMAFVNHDALVKDNFNCSQTATATTELGTIAIG